MNRECVARTKALIDCAMFNMEGHVIPIVPGRTPCLACLYPEIPPHWKRCFPVIGAVSALVAQIGALEGIKLLVDMPGSNLGKMIFLDTVNMESRKVALAQKPDCAVCSGR